MRQLTLLVTLIALTISLVGCDVSDNSQVEPDRVEVRQFADGALASVDADNAATLSITYDGSETTTTEGFTTIDQPVSSVEVTNTSTDKTVAVNIRFVAGSESPFQKGATLEPGESLQASY